MAKIIYFRIIKKIKNGFFKLIFLFNFFRGRISRTLNLTDHDSLIVAE
jgi:hypothetical protein